MGRIYTRDELISRRAEWRREGKRVVFTNGCYDLLHPGHIRLLERARSMGDALILALNTDRSVRRLKGPSRPLISENERAELIGGELEVKRGAGGGTIVHLRVPGCLATASRPEVA